MKAKSPTSTPPLHSQPSPHLLLLLWTSLAHSRPLASEWDLLLSPQGTFCLDVTYLDEISTQMPSPQRGLPQTPPHTPRPPDSPAQTSHICNPPKVHLSIHYKVCSRSREFVDYVHSPAWPLEQCLAAKEVNNAPSADYKWKLKLSLSESVMVACPVYVKPWV